MKLFRQAEHREDLLFSHKAKGLFLVMTRSYEPMLFEDRDTAAGFVEAYAKHLVSKGKAFELHRMHRLPA